MRLKNHGAKISPLLKKEILQRSVKQNNVGDIMAPTSLPVVMVAYRNRGYRL